MNTVVIVEDNYPVRKGLIQMISQIGERYQVIGEAANGIDGYALIRSKRPQIVITDIRLPGLTGLQMIKDIREIYKPQVIVISAYSEFEYAREAIELGVLRYLVKPIEEAVLIESLELASRKCEEADENMSEPAEPVPDATAVSGDGISRYSIRLKKYITKHYADNISVADIARAFNVSESHLNRVFKTDTGYTINEYRNLYKIKAALQLMTDPDLKAYEVGSIVGIDNQRYFSVIFKKYTDMTPLAFREAYLAGKPEAKTVMQKINEMVR